MLYTPVFSLYTVYTGCIRDTAYIPVYAYTLYIGLYTGYGLWAVHGPYIGEIGLFTGDLAYVPPIGANTLYLGLYPDLGLSLEQHRQSS